MPKTTYDKKTGTKTVLDEKGKTVYFKDGRKETYNSKGKTNYLPDGTKQVINSKGLTELAPSGTKATLNSKGKTVYYPDGRKTVSNSKGKTEYTAAEAAALKKATTVSNSITSGKTVKFVDPKTGITHITNDAGGKTTYHKYNKDKTFAGGYTQNAFGVFGAADGGRKIPISADAYNKKPKVEEIKKEPVKPATGQTVAELWKEKTGTSWSEAKKQGLTDGSAKNNLALMAKLKSGEYKPKAKEEVKVEPKVEPKPYVPAGFPARTDGPIADGEQLNEMRRGGRVMTIKKPKMAMGGAKKIVLKKPVKKAMYGTAMKPMKPTMMQMGGAKKYLTGGTTGTPKRNDQTKKATTLKKAMYGTMMKPKMMIKGSTKKK